MTKKTKREAMINKILHRKVKLGRWLSPVSLISSNDKTDHHNTNEKLLNNSGSPGLLDKCSKLFTHTGVQHDFHIILCSCDVTVTRCVSLGKQELLTLPEHLGSYQVFSGVHVAQSLFFSVVCWRSLLFLICSLYFGHCIFSFDLRLLATLMPINLCLFYNE